MTGCVGPGVGEGLVVGVEVGGRLGDVSGDGRGDSVTVGCVGGVGLGAWLGAQAAIIMVGRARTKSANLNFMTLLSRQIQSSWSTSREIVGDQNFERLFEEGAAMSLQDAVAYAMEEVMEE